MAADIIDITRPLEDRQFQRKESKLKALKDAFRAARLDAKAAKSGDKRPAVPSRKKKHKHPGR